MTCSTVLPGEVTAGLDFQAEVVLPDNPAPAWSATLVLRGPGQINLAATGALSTFTFSAPAATTAAWVPGRYWWSLRVSNGAMLEEAAKGQLDILPDLATVTTPYDGRTQNQIALEAINAVIAKRATIDQQRYTINNRELWRTPIPELLKLRAFYAVQVRRESQRNSGQATFGRAIQVRFSQ